MESGLGRGRGGDGGCSSRWSPGHATQAGPVRMAVMLPAQCRSATRKRASGPALSATVPGTVPLPGRPEPQAVSAASHAQSSRPPTESARGRVAGDPSLPQGQRRSPPRRCHGQSQSRASRGGSETRTESAAAAGARRPGGGRAAAPAGRSPSCGYHRVAVAVDAAARRRESSCLSGLVITMTSESESAEAAGPSRAS